MPTPSLQSFITLMRISTLCLALMMGVGMSALEAGITYGQSTENTFLDIEAKHVPLVTVFSMIEEKTNFLFVFPPEIVGQYADVSIKKGRKSVKEILQHALPGKLQYREAGENLVIFDVAHSLSIALPSPDDTKRIAMMPVRGKVTNTSGDPIPGVSVLIKGTTNGTTTDADGMYALEAGVADWLVFTFIGYKKTEVQVGERTMIDLVMEDDVQTLTEVEVVGNNYYEMSDRMKTANITKITSKEITGQTVVSPLLSLQGRVAGLEISPGSGVAGSAPIVRIRGINSMRSNGGYPLYVIDGVMIDSSPLRSQTSVFHGNTIDPLAGINAENIESIEVLKDGDATSIYGSKGANGVILVKTKQNRQNVSAGMEINAYYGTGEIPRFMDVLNTDQYLEMRRDAFKNNNMQPSVFDYDLVRWDSTRYTDWQKVLLDGTSKVSDVELTFSGGNENTSFRVTGGYHKETTFVSDKFGFDRGAAAVSFNHRSADKRFVISTTTNYGLVRNKNLNLSSFIESALTLPPNTPDLYLDDGSLNWDMVFVPEYNLTLNAFDNPMSQLLKTNESTIGTLVANATLSYLVMKRLSLKTSLGYTDMDGNEIIKDPILSRSPTARGPGATADALFSVNKRRSWVIEPQIAYDLELRNHGFNVLIGSTFQQSSNQWQAVSASGYSSDVLLNSLRGATLYSYPFDDRTEYRYAAAFARIGYNWKKKYLINLTGRRDGSSRFGPGKQFGNFGAVGVAWIFSSEKFMESSSSIVSFGKLRASYGTTGNDQIEDYKFYNLYEIGGFNYQGATTLVPTGLFNENFNWEVTKKTEVAMETNFFKDRLSIQASWYLNRSSNQIVAYQLPATTGFTSISKNFVATVENRGWEFLIQSQNLRSSNFVWSTSVNMTFPRNRLVSFPGIDDSPYASVYEIDESLSIQNLYQWRGVDSQTGLHVIADIDDSGTLNDKDRVFGNSLAPKYYGGITNTIRYKSVEFSFLFQFTKQIGQGPNYLYPGSFMGNQPVEVSNRWRTEGDVSNVSKASTDFNLYNDFSVYLMNSTYNVVDASFIRLKTVSLSYDIPSLLSTKLKIRQARVFIQGQNLFVISNFVGLDPETGARSMPQLKTITGGINLKF